MLMVKLGAPGLKSTLLTSIAVGMLTPVTFDGPKLATSDGPLGTMAGIQFAAVFQSPLEGFVLHVALPARQCRCATRDSSAAAIVRVNLT
jgi:hypothetical protein